MREVAHRELGSLKDNQVRESEVTNSVSEQQQNPRLNCHKLKPVRMSELFVSRGKMLVTSSRFIASDTLTFWSDGACRTLLKPWPTRSFKIYDAFLTIAVVSKPCNFIFVFSPLQL